MPKQTPKKQKLTEAERMAREARAEKVRQVQVTLGYIIVGIATVWGFFVHPAVGIGFVILAGIRLYALRREVRREAAEKELDPQPVGGNRPARASVKRA